MSFCTESMETPTLFTVEKDKNTGGKKKCY